MTRGENEVVYDAGGVREEPRITRRRTVERETHRVGLPGEEVSGGRVGAGDARADESGEGGRASRAATHS